MRVDGLLNRADVCDRGQHAVHDLVEIRARVDQDRVPVVDPLHLHGLGHADVVGGFEPDQPLGIPARTEPVGTESGPQPVLTVPDQLVDAQPVGDRGAGVVREADVVHALQDLIDDPHDVVEPR